MRVHVIGGGPGGLYLAILLKRRDPTHEVVVWERNRADDTFGWGVVFSDMTQSHLRGADPESYEAITRSFATWDSIDVHYRARVMRSSGHGFCGLSRKTLLQILRDRALELGVTVHFETEVTDLDTHRDCDLLVGADGLRSGVRAAQADIFGPSLDVRPNRYIWFGSRQPLDAFTFSFRENEHGLFMLHAYQFEPGTSTFIVECDDETWKATGLTATDEKANAAYCERVFAEELGGQPLLCTRSHFIQFTTVKNRTWHAGRTVLIGDAAHTAHFSIGSGTKLAMEDAIALADALGEERDVSVALANYERDRRPQVDSVQRAAQSSLEWFENAKRYMGFSPEQFHFSLLTRSMRVTHENLQKRDPDLVHEADAWFEGAVGGAKTDSSPAGMPSKVSGASPRPPMFLPFRLRGMDLDNRVVVSPMCQYSAANGTPDDWHLVHLGSRAMGGAGLVIAEMTNVSEEGRITQGCTGLYKDEHVTAWRRIVDFVHRNSRAKIGIQLGHAGRKGACRLPWEGGQPLEQGAWSLEGPSAVPWNANSQAPVPMTRADMDRVRDAFVRSAQRALEADFDLLEVHMAHGYLLSSFLSPLSNHRTDEYGGSLENRARFPLEILRAVREVWPEERPLSVRISATDWVDGAFDGDDAVALAHMLKHAGTDLIDVSSGQTSEAARPQYGRAYQTPFADRVRNEVGIATMAVGNISTYDDINTIVLAGRADLVALARAHLADPYFTLHAAREQGYAEIPWPPQYQAARGLRFLVR
ncbi:MAG: bifunctional salicylyl-CoA 5-hydroxylase/oxidoreductase [Myxococcales bacterium]|nr:bifunctional salicylyl-CoA 5-hydroxylase/oxidoreductase [Myxococcales bacterium]